MVENARCVGPGWLTMEGRNKSLSSCPRLVALWLAWFTLGCFEVYTVRL